MLDRLATARPYRNIFSVGSPFSWITLACVNSTKLCNPAPKVASFRICLPGRRYFHWFILEAWECLIIVIYCLRTCKWPYIVFNCPVCLYVSKWPILFFAKDTLVWLVMLCVGGVVGRAGPSLLEGDWDCGRLMSQSLETGAEMHSYPSCLQDAILPHVTLRQFAGLLFRSQASKGLYFSSCSSLALQRQKGSATGS